MSTNSLLYKGNIVITMSDLTAHVKRVNVNENVLLSITDSNGESVNWFMYEGTRVFLLGGEVYTDEEMYRMPRTNTRLLRSM